MDNLAWLSAFVHAADLRSFTIAGRHLGVSSSAIGKAIARLEQKVGVRLFHRSTRTITLTPEGATFLERCRRILGEIEAAEAELAKTRAAPRGRLRVSLPLNGGMMMPALSAFMRAYPEVQLDLDFSDRLVDVIDEGFDAVVRAGDVTDSRLMSRILGEFKLKLVASPDYLARRGTPKRPEDLCAHACLHHRFPTSGKLERWPLCRNGKDIDVAPAAAAIVNTIEPLIYMAERGLGIACLQDSVVQRQIENDILRSVLDEYVAHVGIFRLLWPSSRYPSPKLRVFIDFITHNLFPAAPAATSDTRKRRRKT